MERNVKYSKQEIYSQMMEQFFQYVKFGNLTRARAMIDMYMVGVNYCGPEGTALHVATCYGHSDMVKYLISKKAKVDYEFEGKTPLVIAVEEANIEIAKILIDNGADIKFEHFIDLLDFAIYSDEPEMIDFILSQGFDIDRHGILGTPLITSAICTKQKSFKFLLKKGADYRIYTEWDQNVKVEKIYPMIGCLKSDDCRRFMQILFSHIEKKEGKSALIDYINHADPTSKVTALHVACRFQNEDGVKILTEMGANTEVKDCNGWKPLDHVEHLGKNPKSERIRSMLESSQKK